MKQALKTSQKASQRALFLRERLCFTPKKGKKPSKTPPAVDYRGIFRQKKYAVKEPDPETGLYYYGARYLDPKTSRWISGDPALGEYLPSAPVNDEAKKRNGNLPGMGGVFNVVNMHAYHYAGNNPVKYVDPDGNDIVLLNRSYGALGFGHNAVLVGNNDDGWILYSKDDIGVNTRTKYKNLSEFYRDNKNSTYEKRYDKVAYLSTTKEQDEAMQEYGDQHYNHDYSPWDKTKKAGKEKQNCADLVADIVRAGGVSINKPKITRGSTSREGPYKWKDLSFPKGKIKSPVYLGITFPNKQFEEFIKININKSEDET